MRSRGTTSPGSLDVYGNARKIQRTTVDSLAERSWLLSAVLHGRHQRVVLGITGKIILARRGKSSYKTAISLGLPNSAP